MPQLVTITTAQSFSIERKIKMHEAREAIIKRLAPGFHSAIDLDRFLRAVVSEIGRMMNVDRCDLIQLAAAGGCVSNMSGAPRMMCLRAWA
ncbi:MAG: hypothetical protein WKF30_14340 [Pyrinomonadaceae bacterium]